MDFSLIFSNSFYFDLDKAIDYISKDLSNAQAAKNLLEKVTQSLLQIEKFPYSCPIVSNAFIPGKDLRRKVINNYSLFYKIDEKNKTVVVLRLILSRRNHKA